MLLEHTHTHTHTHTQKGSTNLPPQGITTPTTPQTETPTTTVKE